MGQTIYNKKILKYFKNPKNLGPMENPDATGETSNSVCGDIMKIAIKVKNKKITDIKFQTFGCAVAIANSSIITEIAKGKTIEQAKKITDKDLIKFLGKIPPLKFHCSSLAINTLKKTIKNWEKKHKN